VVVVVLSSSLSLLHEAHDKARTIAMATYSKMLCKFFIIVV